MDTAQVNLVRFKIEVAASWQKCYGTLECKAKMITLDNLWLPNLQIVDGSKSSIFDHQKFIIFKPNINIDYLTGLIIEFRIVERIRRIKQYDIRI